MSGELDTITPGERRELRAVVRAQIKVLRTEVKQRKSELLAEAERRLVDKYRDEDKAVDDLNFRIREVAAAAQREIDDLMKSVGLETEGGRWRSRGGRIDAYGVSRQNEDRSQLHRAMLAGIEEQVNQALLKLDRQEADLLRALAAESLQSQAARSFLERIPTVGELVPAARLREIESAFDEGKTS